MVSEPPLFKTAPGVSLNSFDATPESGAPVLLKVSQGLRFDGGYIGVLFRLVWLKTDGTGLDGFYPICQGHLFAKRPPLGGFCSSLPIFSRDGIFNTALRALNPYLDVQPAN